MSFLRLLLTCLLLALPLASAIADEEGVAAQETATPDLQTLLQQLATASLREARDLLPMIVAEGGARILPLLDAMVAGELHVAQGSSDFYRVSEDSAGEELVHEVLTRNAVEPAAVKALKLKKVRVNNLLRSLLRESIARLSLLEGSPAERKTAALRLLDSADAELLPLLQEALAQETDSAVRELLETGVALAIAQSSAASDERLAALDLLEGRLEPVVRNVVARLAEDGDADAVLQARAADNLQGIESRIRF